MAQDWKSRVERAKLRTAAVNKLTQMGIECNSRWHMVKLAQVIRDQAGASAESDPIDVLRMFVAYGVGESGRGREINAMRQPPMAYPAAFIVAPQRARAVQPPMISMCGLREGWDG